MGTLNEKAVSKAQQKLFGIAHAIQKGDMKPSEAKKPARDIAKTVSKAEVKKFAKTKRKGLPEKVKKESISFNKFNIVSELLLGSK